MVFLNVWCTHTGKYKPESPSLKIFRHWKIHNQNKANLWSMNFPSNWSKPLVFVFLYSERWNFLLCDTLMLTKHKEVRQEGISFHKKKNGLASLLLQRGIIWQIASNLKFPWEKKKLKKKIQRGEERQHGHGDLPFIASRQDEGGAVAEVFLMLCIAWKEDLSKEHCQPGFLQGHYIHLHRR